VVVAFIFFDWLVPQKSQPEAVRNARSRVVLQGTGQWLMSLLPEDPENTILKKLKKRPADDEAAEVPGQRSERAGDDEQQLAQDGDNPAVATTAVARPLGAAAVKRHAKAA
jgi:membrane protein required for colicin V production